MFGSLLGSLGSVIGNRFGGGIFSTIGKYGGQMLGNMLSRKFSHKNSKKIYNTKYENTHDGFYIHTPKYGDPIPLIFGNMIIDGKIIWMGKIKKTDNNTKRTKRIVKGSINPILSTSTNILSNSGILPKNPLVNSLIRDVGAIRGRDKHIITDIVHCEYYASFALAICEGEIKSINRVWFNEEIIDLEAYNYRLYKGSEEQMPDPLINSSNNTVPAFRGLAYIVFEELPLEDFGNVIPHFTFEVHRKPNVLNGGLVEEMIEAVNIIPGCGEYVYDTIIQNYKLTDSHDKVIDAQNINAHHSNVISDSVIGLDQLQDTCQNIKWSALVVSWFADSLDLENVRIVPGIEFNEPLKKYSEIWKVGNYDRDTAHQIGKITPTTPRYGGTPSDNSILRYVCEMKKRDIKVMFYPMFFVDIDQKPWRGRLTGDAKYVKNFFNKHQGYNEFIIHYANLVKGHVDAFIIGTELIGLTKIKSQQNTFPTVDELVDLAKTVKNILGDQVLVSYAADWSEYHHTEGGYYNLDKLWASENIDFIGIDAYFPVTDAKHSNITSEEISKGFESGEGYEYYFDSDRSQKHKLAKPYAWKNIRYWWENEHFNPDGVKTPWVPKSKPIWFTEYGFPSIDKATNQPNIFFDPFAVEGGVPRYSNSDTNFAIQRQAIAEFIKYWSTQEYIENMFLWCWDARPYPQWPHMKIWFDDYAWEKGHWINGKFNGNNLSAILIEISQRCNIPLESIDTWGVDDIVDGLIFSHHQKAFDAINILRVAYFFDLAFNKNKITFVKRSKKLCNKIVSSDLLNLNKDSKNIVEINVISEDMIVNEVELYALDMNNDYSKCHYHKKYDFVRNCKNVESVRLPLLFTKIQLRTLAEKILRNANSEKAVIRFNLPITYIYLKPTDFIELDYNIEQYKFKSIVRIISIEIKNHLIMDITAIIDNIENYIMPVLGNRSNYIQNNYNLIKFMLFEMPPITQEIADIYAQNTNILSVHLNHISKLPLYIANDSHRQNWQRVKNLMNTNSIYKISEIKQKKSGINNLFIDMNTNIYIEDNGYSAIENIIKENDKWHCALLGCEIISFRNIEKIDESKYVISHLMRRLFDSNEFGSDNSDVNDLVILSPSPNLFELESNEDQKNNFIIHKFKVPNCKEQKFIEERKFLGIPKARSNYFYCKDKNLLFIIIKMRLYQAFDWNRKAHDKFVINMNLHIKTNDDDIYDSINLNRNNILDDYIVIDLDDYDIQSLKNIYFNIDHMNDLTNINIVQNYTNIFMPQKGKVRLIKLNKEGIMSNRIEYIELVDIISDNFIEINY